MIVVDASVLIAFLDPSDVHHVAAVEMLADAAPPLLVHPVTAAEVLVAAVRQGVAEAVWADLSAIGVEVDDMPTDPIELARLRVETGCKMPDCCVLVTAALHDTSAATFDERLRRFVVGPPTSRCSDIRIRRRCGCRVSRMSWRRKARGVRRRPSSLYSTCSKNFTNGSTNVRTNPVARWLASPKIGPESSMT